MPQKMTTEQKIQNAITRHPDWTNGHVADNVRGANVAMVQAVRVGATPDKSPDKLPVKPATKSTRKSLADFRNMYDKDTIIPSRVKAALKELGASWEYESEFVRRAGVTHNDLGNYRDEFADYFVPIKKDGKKAWAGNVALAQQLREIAS